MAALSFLLAVVAALVVEANYVPSTSNQVSGDGLPEAEFYIHFPRTTEIGCYKGTQPPKGAKGVFFLLDRMLSHDHTCRFITYNMRDYQGTNDAYRFRRLITMYPEIVRPDRKLQCDEAPGDESPIAATDFEISRSGETSRCRMVVDISSRSGVPENGRPRESYKRLPGGLLLLRASFDLDKPRRFRRSAQEVPRNHGSSSSNTGQKGSTTTVQHKNKLQRRPSTRNLFEKVGRTGK